MQERRQSAYPLLRQFRDFYREVARLRRMVAEGYAAGAAGAAQDRLESATKLAPIVPPGTQAESASAITAIAELPAQNPDTDPETTLTLQVWQAVTLYLDQKMFEVRHAPSVLSRDLLEELVYIMAAFADETFICLVDWPGAAYWRDHLMELRLFRSQISGQAIFSRIDDLLTREDYGAPELCAVYLMALSLGFRGRYLRQPAKVEAYRSRLYDRLIMINPSMRRESPRIFPEAYRHTVSEGAPVRLPEPKTWWLAVAGIVGVWLIVSTVVWWKITAPMRPVLKQTSDALAAVVNHPAAAAQSSWTARPFEPSNGALRVDLPANLAASSGTPGSGLNPAGGTLAPGTLLIGVTGPEGASPGAVDKVRTWLAGGMIVFPSAIGNMEPQSRAIQSVAQATSLPPGIVLSGTAQFFAVNTGLAVQQLAQHPQLILPAGGPDGTATADAVVLLLPPLTSPTAVPAAND